MLCDNCKCELSAQQVKVGDIIHGYAGGYFGRDSYDCRRVEIVACDYVVTRDSNGVPEFAMGSDILTKLFEYTLPEACCFGGRQLPGCPTDGT